MLPNYQVQLTCLFILSHYRMLLSNLIIKSFCKVHFSGPLMRSLSLPIFSGPFLRILIQVTPSGLVIRSPLQLTDPVHLEDLLTCNPLLTFCGKNKIIDLAIVYCITPLSISQVHINSVLLLNIVDKNFKHVYISNCIFQLGGNFESIQNSCINLYLVIIWPTMFSIHMYMITYHEYFCHYVLFSHYVSRKSTNVQLHYCLLYFAL